MFSIGDDFKNIMDEVKDACKPKMTETNKQTAPDIIEIGGIKYQRVEEQPQPRTLHNILQTYWNVDESESICGFVEKWIPQYSCDWVVCKEYLDGYTDALNNLKANLK